MEVQCRGCAGCCIDWRSLASYGALEGDTESDDGGKNGTVADELRGSFPSLDDVYNLVPLERDEVRAFVDAGLGDVLTPRLWAAGETDPHVEVGDRRVAAVDGRPAFFVGLRKPPKPVAPFDIEEATWLPTCIFLDPTTLQCRIHDDDLYPAECSAYPAHNVVLDRSTECERVETATGKNRLLSTDDAETVAGKDGLLLGPQAIGGKVFCHPRPGDVAEAVERIARGEATGVDRAEFVAVAAASSPGTLAISDSHYEAARKRTLAATSWGGEAIDEWNRLAGDDRRGPETPRPELAERVEDDRGAPSTPGWDVLTDG